MKYISEILLSVVHLLFIALRTIVIKRYDRSEGQKPAKVLLLTTDFLPNINGGVYRPLSWLKYSDNDIRIDVVTSESKSSDVSKELEKNIPSNVNRFYVKKHLYIYRFARFFTDRPSFMISSYLFCRRKYKNDRPDIIVATGPCFGSFVVAAALSNIFKCKLVLDYRDEWTDNPFDFVKPAYLDNFFEKNCLQRAELVILTTESQRKRLTNKYKIHDFDKKTKVISNGFDLVGTQFQPELKRQRSGKVISFAGALAEHTDPGQFLALMEKVYSQQDECTENVKVQFIGSKSRDVQAKLDNFKYRDSVISIAQQDPDALNNILNESDFLLLIVDERFKRYIPGKLFEYIRLEKPILVVGVGACGPDYEIFEILNKYSYAYFVSTPTEITEALKHKSEVQPELMREFESKYNRKYLAETFWDSLDKLQ